MGEIASVALDTAQLERLGQAFRAAPKIAKQELRAAMEDVLQMLYREVMERTPAGATESLRGSVTTDLRGTEAGDVLRGRVFSSLAHAAPVELGTKPHYPWDKAKDQFPESLIDWARSKGYSGDDAVRVAHIVAGSIKRYGTKGKHMFGNTIKENEDQVRRTFARYIERIFARLGESN